MATLSCKKLAKPNITVGPIKNIRAIKDLTIDRDEYEKKITQIKIFPREKMQP